MDRRIYYRSDRADRSGRRIFRLELVARSDCAHGQQFHRQELRNQRRFDSPSRIVANDIVLGNAAWSREPNMATIKRLNFRIDILKLLGGSVSFPEMALSEPHVVLEVGKDGTPNWIFNAQDRKKPVEFPTIGALTIDRGSATYRDPEIDTDLALDIKTLKAGNDNPKSSLEAAGKGRFKGMATTLHARGGALLSLRSVDHPYPIKAIVMLGTTKASIEGMLLDPLHLRGEQLTFQLDGSDLALLFPIIGVPIPPTPAYKLAGFLDHTGDVWTFRRFKGTVGQSDIAGDFSVDRSKHPQMITAGLVSQKLNMKDFGGFIGAGRGTKPSEIPPPNDRVLPAEPFSLEKLKAANADVPRRQDCYRETTDRENERASHREQRQSQARAAGFLGCRWKSGVANRNGRT